MAWTGTLARTERHGDSLTVIIHYMDNQEREYDQTITTSSAQGDSWLQDQINTKLQQLSDLDTFETALTSKNAVDTAFTTDESGVLVIGAPEIVSEVV